jgi:hypothetical protein
MSEFNFSNEEDSTVRELLQRLGENNAEQTSTERLTQQSSIQDLLAYDNDIHEDDKLLIELRGLTEQECDPGTLDSQNPIFEEVLTSTIDPKRQAAEDLELLTQMICDRFSPRLKSEMERRGFHRSDRIFSHQLIVTHPSDSAQTALSSLKSEQAEVLERLAQEIEQLLYHRLIYEHERLGRFLGCLPW